MEDKSAFFETDYLVVNSNEEHGVVWAHWHKMTSTDNLITGTDQYIHGVQHYDVPYVLADLRNMQGSFTAIIEWVMTDWSPRAYKAGMKAIALITSSDIFVKFSLKTIDKQYQEGDQRIKFQIFDTPEAGLTWLKSHMDQ